MEIIEELADDLVLRRATAADTEALVAFNAWIHRQPGEDSSTFIANWCRDLLSGGHPACSPDDFTVVVSTRTGEIVSSLNLIAQTWSYGGIPFGVGRIEMVGTHPDYRKRGLVRRQMEVVHRWSHERGHLVQAITGIPNFYRQFGYEMALSFGGGRGGFRSNIPDLPAEASEPCLVRPATTGDIAFIEMLDTHARQRALVAAVRDLETWRYELEGRHEAYRHAVRIITRPDGEPIGCLAHPGELWGPVMAIQTFELVAGTSWLEMTPGILRHLGTTAESYQDKPGASRWERFSFLLGTEHPVYQVIPSRLPRTLPPYAYHLRVADLAAFLRHVAPVLEERLAGSGAAGHSGELRVGFYRDGLRLVLAGGRIATVEAWEPGDEWESAPGFPGLTFLQMLFGYRSLAELEYAFADCQIESDESRVLLDALFPRQPSNVWAID